MFTRIAPTLYLNQGRRRGTEAAWINLIFLLFKSAYLLTKEYLIKLYF